MSVRVEPGDCLGVLPRLAAEGVRVDAVVTDPPYGLGFMGKKWDHRKTVAFRPETWAAVAAVMKPGAHLVAFGGTRTYHRLACAIEDAGFEIRDMVAWLYGSGFPKSHDVSKALDREAGATREKIRISSDEVRNPKATGAGRDGMEGATRPWIEAALQRGYHEKDSDTPATDAAHQWSGWGTALKPALEPIVLARLPLGEKTVAANVLRHGTGALNIDACRIDYTSEDDAAAAAAAAAQRLCQDRPGRQRFGDTEAPSTGFQDPAGSLATWQARAHLGRWPANVVHDGSKEVVAGFPETAPSPSGLITQGGDHFSIGSEKRTRGTKFQGHGDSGSAARFFYSSKADDSDRLGSKHPTVKPVDLMAWLVKLITPPGGTVLDPFAGTGTTGMACLREGFNAILIEREAEYIADIRRRLAHVKGEDAPLFAGAGP